MSDNPIIELVARLKKDKASIDLIKNDIESISSILDKQQALKVVCHINTEVTKHLQGELNQLSKNLNLNVGVNTQGVNNSTTTNIKVDSTGAKKQADELTNILTQQLQGKASNSIANFVNSIRSQLDDSSKIWTTWSRTAEGALTGFTVSIQKAEGEVNKFKFLVSGDEFTLLGSVGGDKGELQNAEKILSFIDEYRTKINSLKAESNQNLTTVFQGKTVGFTSLLEDLDKLKSGQGSIEDVRAKFVALKGEIDSIRATIKESQGKSLNPFTNANITATEFDNTLKTIKVDIDKLKGFSVDTKDSNGLPTVEKLKQEYDELTKTITKLNAVEQSQRDNKWYLSLAEASVRVRQLQNDIKLLNKLKREDTSSSEKQQLEALAKIQNAYREIQKLEKRRFSDKAGDNEIKRINSLEGGYRRIINAAQERLRKKRLLTTEIKNLINAEEKALTTSRNYAIAQQKDREATRQQTEEVKKQQETYANIVSTLNKYRSALSGFNTSNITKQNASNTDVQKQVAENQTLLEQIEKISQPLSGGKKNTSATNIEQARQALERLIPTLDNAKKSSESLNQSLMNGKGEQALASRINNLINQMNKFANTNPKVTKSLKQMRDGMTFADKWQQMVSMLQSGRLDGNAVQQLTNDFRNFKGEADSANLTTSRFFTSMQTQLRMVLQRWISLYAVIGYIRKMIDNIKELDTAMINLQRVTHETGGGYERFLANASDRAKELKTTTSALIEQSYQWAKLGYDMEDSLKLSEASTIFSRVADVGQEQALNNLVTAMKAYGIEAEDVMSIVDKLDKLNNEYAVSAAGLGDGLERAASAMAMTGNSIDQTLAMLTGAGEITQNLETTANGLRIVGLRLQGMKGKLEELNEPVDDLMEVSRIQTQILNLTKNQVDIFDQETGEFRSTYDIMADISAIWKDLSSTSRASLTEILFGKNRANIGLALIQSFQSGQVQAAYKDLGNAAGTALEENEKLMTGVQAAMDDFKRAFQDLSTALMKSDGLKFIINSASKILDLITQIGKTFGSLPTVIAPVIALISGKSGIGLISIINRIRGKNITEVATAINGVATAETNAAGATVALGQAERTTAGATKTLAASLKTLGSALLTGLAIGAVTWGIQKIIENITEAKKQAEELREQGIQAAKAYKEERESMESLETQYTNLIASTTDVTEIRERLISLQDQMKDKYGEEAEGIDLVNGKLSENLALQEQIKKANAEEYVTANRAAYLQAKSELEKVYTEYTTTKAGIATPDSGYMFNAPWQKFTEEEWNTILNVAPELHSEVLGKSFSLSGTLEEQLESLKKIRDEYSKIGSNDKIKQQLEDDYQELKKKLKKTVDETKDIIQAYEDNIKTMQEDVTIANNFTVQNGIDQIQAQYVAFQNAVKEGKFTDAIDIKSGIEFLQDVVKNQLDEGSDSYNTVMQFFSMIDLNINNISDDITAFQAEFNNFVEKTFGDATKEIDEVDSALGKLFEGKTISHADAWKIFGYDTDNILKDVEIVNGEYKFSIEQTIELRNKLIEKIKEQAIEEQKEIGRKRQMAEANVELERSRLRELRSNVNSAADVALISKQQEVIKEAEDKVKSYNVLWSRSELLVRQLNSRLTQTRDETESIKNQTSVLESQIKNIKTDIEELNKVADGLLKAQETAIDNITDGYEKQKEEIEKSKTALEEQLATLEEQKTNLEDIIKNYETVNSVVQETVKDQISQIEESRKATEEYYDNLINNLKTENEEREDALTYAEKLAALENAQKNKKRTYSSARGWTYESDISAINAAQNDLTSFENEQAIKKLEEERDKALLPYDSQIKAYEDYAKQWEDVTTSVSKLEDEKLAQDILGADWRQKINEQDIDLLTDYSKAYSSYNTQLKSLTNNEISSLKTSIAEREKQIKAIDSEIKKWNDYKNEVTKTANSIKNSFDDANRYLYTAMVNENSTLQERQNNINNFANNYRNAIQSITDKQGEVDRLQQALNKLNDTKVNLDVNASNIQSAAEALERAASKMWQSTYDLGRTIADSVFAKIPIFGSHANGGVVDYTGTAMMHGTKQKSEVVFNAADASKLYQYIHTTPNLIASAISNAGRLNMAMNRNSSISNNNGVTISHMTVVANNPTEFSRAFQREMTNYLDLSFMASKVK